MSQAQTPDWSTIDLVPTGCNGRDEAWLQALLDTTWDRWFPEVMQDNDVRIVYGRRAKRRLGSISLDPTDRRTSVVTMNGHFREAAVPEFVILATLVHELTHYAQGFNSPLARTQKHPHAGGVMRREYAERGLLSLYLQQKLWLKREWATFLLSQSTTPSRQIATRQRPTAKTRVPKLLWFSDR